ncbi:MAG: hypothetical protein IJX80_05085 [Clostridia bacterium]|nr:hypothetical protein [Clostridia bacterium]
MESSKLLFSGCMRLTEEHIYFGGMNLTYQLLAFSEKGLSRYRIRIVKNEESDVADLGTDLVRAVERYQMLVRGIVTPCALQDVIQELLYA